MSHTTEENVTVATVVEPGIAEEASIEDRLARLEDKMDQVVKTTNRIRRQQEMVGDLKEDLMPMANGIIALASQKLHEMETDGSLDDVKELSQHLVPALSLLAQLTQPQVLALGAATAEALETAGDAKPVGMWGMMGALKDPDAKKGLGVMVHLLQALGKASK